MYKQQYINNIKAIVREDGKKIIYNKTDEQLNNDTKQTIISLAYTDSLSSSDILELSEILLTISKYKTPNKKKGL